MSSRKSALRLGAALAAVALLWMLAAPSVVAEPAGPVTIDPQVNDFVLAAGEEWLETVTVTVPPGAGVTKADIYLLADTTGSMGGPINAVKGGASDIVDGLIAELPDIDLAFGVGDFKDFQSPTQRDPYAFYHAQSITADSVAVKTAIGGWSANGGWDGPEGQFFAYDQLAADTDPLGGSIGWRPDAKRILVVFGDAPAHDPVCAAISGLAYDITEASVTAKLAAAGITFLGISTITGYAAGMDDDPTLYGGDYMAACGIEGGEPGQATRIAAATGGGHVVGVDSSQIVQVIKDQITSAVGTLNELRLVPTGDTAAFVGAITPAQYGPLAGDVEHVLPFDVHWVGVQACDEADQVFTGTLDVVADGAVAAQKSVRITVPACPPEPVLDGWMTGGGSAFTAGGMRVTHGFTLQCDATRQPNRLQVNWGRGNRFHLEELTTALCTDDPDIDPSPPAAAFDTYTGTGNGRYNNQPGATAEWTFTDAGQPGRGDHVDLRIWDAGGALVLEVFGYLQGGNHQAHDR